MQAKFTYQEESIFRKYFIVIAVVLILIAIIAAYSLLAGKNNAVPTNGAPSAATQQDNAGAINGQPKETVREGYGIPLAIFESLPEMPADFNRLVSMVHKGKFSNYAFFSREYFLQPEFYPSFPANALPYWKTPDPSHYVAMGYGFFPGRQKITISRGSTATARFFVHSAFGVQSWQGMGIRLLQEGAPLPIEIKIDGQDFIIGPTFPKFSPEWAHAVDVIIRADEGAEAGNYALRFAVAAPSAAKSSEWRMLHARYFDAADAGASLFHTIEAEIR